MTYEQKVKALVAKGMPREKAETLVDGQMLKSLDATDVAEDAKEEKKSKSALLKSAEDLMNLIAGQGDLSKASAEEEEEEEEEDYDDEEEDMEKSLQFDLLFGDKGGSDSEHSMLKSMSDRIGDFVTVTTAHGEKEKRARVSDRKAMIKHMTAQNAVIAHLANLNVAMSKSMGTMQEQIAKVLDQPASQVARTIATAGEEMNKGGHGVSHKAVSDAILREQRKEGTDSMRRARLTKAMSFLSAGEVPAKVVESFGINLTA